MSKSPFQGLTLRQVAADYGMTVCVDAASCKRGWSYTTHRDGKIDRMGHIHWAGIDGRITKAGLHKLLVMIGRHAYRTGDPEWEKIYKTEVWAYRQALTRYRIRFTVSVTLPARRRAARLARDATVRTTNFAAYQWIYVAPHRSTNASH